MANKRSKVTSHQKQTNNASEKPLDSIETLIAMPRSEFSENQLARNSIHAPWFSINIGILRHAPMIFSKNNNILRHQTLNKMTNKHKDHHSQACSCNFTYFSRKSWHCQIGSRVVPSRPFALRPDRRPALQCQEPQEGGRILLPLSCSSIVIPLNWTPFSSHSNNTQQQQKEQQQHSQQY